MGCAAAFEEAVERYGVEASPFALRPAERQRFTVGVEGARLELILGHQESEGSVREWLRIEGAVHGASDLELELGGGLWARVRALFRRVDVGVPELDGTPIRTNDAELARLWLRGGAGAAYARSRCRALRVDRGLMVVRLRDNVAFAELDAALRAGALVAARAEAVTAELRALAAALDGTVPDGTWAPGALTVAFARGMLRVELDHLVELPDEPAAARGLRTRLRCGRSIPGPVRWALHHRAAPPARWAPRDGLAPVAIAGGDASPWAAFSDDPGPAAATIARARHELDAAAPETVVVDDSFVTVILRGAPLDRDRLRAAVDLTFELAREPVPGNGTPYRG